MAFPPSLARDISPPPPTKRRKTSHVPSLETRESKSARKHEPTLAAVEAGKAKVDDHLAYFRLNLEQASRETAPDFPRLSISGFAALYEENLHDHGHHFVIHQHNHPKAGVHYDLRLQFSATSSVSWSIPKGLPGNPNSKSIGRMAIETRIHNFWNHLIESASKRTGSLLIWDTGTYSVLPRKTASRDIGSQQTTDEESESDADVEQNLSGKDGKQENEKLVEAFQTRYVRLRLHGTRLPDNYTVILRLPSNQIMKHPQRRRKKSSNRGPDRNASRTHLNAEGQVEEDFDEQNQEDHIDTDSSEDDQIRAQNAYPGSTNSIGSVHQRHWFLQLDRQNSGFVLDKSSMTDNKGGWARRPGEGFEPFFVRGRDHERSVVTGRLAREVESDEGVEGYVGRGGWVGIEH